MVVELRAHHLRTRGTIPMLYAGIDYHKRYSQVHVVDERGRTRASARLTYDLVTVRRFFGGWENPAALQSKKAGTGA